MTDPSGEPAAGEDAPPNRGAARRQSESSSAFHEHVRAARSEFEQQIDRARADFEQVQDRINERTGRNLLMATLIGLAVGAGQPDVKADRGGLGHEADGQQHEDPGCGRLCQLA